MAYGTNGGGGGTGGSGGDSGGAGGVRTPSTLIDVAASAVEFPAGSGILEYVITAEDAALGNLLVYVDSPTHYRISLSEGALLSTLDEISIISDHVDATIEFSERTLGSTITPILGDDRTVEGKGTIVVRKDATMYFWVVDRNPLVAGSGATLTKRIAKPNGMAGWVSSETLNMWADSTLTIVAMVGMTTGVSSILASDGTTNNYINVANDGSLVRVNSHTGPALSFPMPSEAVQLGDINTVVVTKVGTTLSVSVNGVASPTVHVLNSTILLHEWGYCSADAGSALGMAAPILHIKAVVDGVEVRNVSLYDEATVVADLHNGTFTATEDWVQWFIRHSGNVELGTARLAGVQPPWGSTQRILRWKGSALRPAYSVAVSVQKRTFEVKATERTYIVHVDRPTGFTNQMTSTSSVFVTGSNGDRRLWWCEYRHTNLPSSWEITFESVASGTTSRVQDLIEEIWEIV